jgi:uncharacterized protein involved in exopolysaccharide biosynthesis
MDQEQKLPDIYTRGTGGNHEDAVEPELKQILLPYLRNIWAARRRLVLFNAVFITAVVVYQLEFVKPYFDSKITILPDYGSKSTGLNNLGGLAAMAGVALNDGGSAPDIYQNLLTSESVLGPVVTTRYQTQKFSDSVDLIQYFKLNPDNNLPESLRRRKQLIDAFKLLNETVIATELDKPSRILTLTVRMPESQLAASVSNKIVQSLDDYVRTKRKSNVTLQVFYIEKRIEQVKDSLNRAENQLEYFQMGNRLVGQSPRLNLEQSRLSRQIQIFQTVYAELLRQREIAKIDEIRDAPIINLREFAQDPVIKAGPSRARSVIILTFLSAIFSMGYFAFADKIKPLLAKLKSLKF